MQRCGPVTVTFVKGVHVLMRQMNHIGADIFIINADSLRLQ